MKLIYIRTGYDSGITLPIEALPLVDKIQLIKNKGYDALVDLEIHPELKSVIHLIDSSDIGAAARKARYIAEAQEDLAQNQKALDRLLEK